MIDTTVVCPDCEGSGTKSTFGHEYTCRSCLGHKVLGATLAGPASTLGTAVEAAVLRHVELYAESAVYSATVTETKYGYRVELRAEHFSLPLLYRVDRS